jgi:2-polyprenyl-6-methoxyphenol hydroxylase-like FAD-dependent oxidoreductase
MTTIVVVGGGTAGALATGIIASRMRDCRVINVQSPTVPIIGVGEATTPPFVQALHVMNIAEEFVDQACCWPKYGTIFRGWHDQPLFGGWAVNGWRNETITYLHGLTKGEHTGRIGEQVTKGLIPYDQEQEKFYTNIAVHIDAYATAKFIFDKIKDRVDSFIVGNVTDVVTSSTGIDSIIIDHKKSIEADYWIDATGFKRVLISKLHPEWIWSKSPVNAAVYTEIKDDEDQINDMMTTATVGNAGWFWNIPLEKRHGTGYVYSTDFLDREQAAIEFKTHLGQDVDVEFLEWDGGYLKTPRIKNVAAVGLAAGFLDALDAPSLGLTVGHIFAFINHIDNISDHNDNVVNGFKDINDYLTLHYKTSTAQTGAKSNFWNSIEKHTEKELINKFIDLLGNKGWRERTVSGFTRSISARVISSSIKLEPSIALEIYNNVPIAERIAAEQAYNMVKDKYVPYTHDLFKKHVMTAHRAGSSWESRKGLGLDIGQYR